MFAPRAPDEQIDSYAGPYERWTFSEELGFPFAFPAIRNGMGDYFAALMEGSGLPDIAEVRVPPLWSETPQVTPFAMYDPEIKGLDIGQSPDRRLGKILDDLGKDLAAPRFRLNMPIEKATWAETYDPACDIANWTPPRIKPKVIIGVIDDGLPFLHRAFLDQNEKSRINLCWLQAARADKKAAVPFGREITHNEINDLRATHGNQELKAYRAAGAIDRDLPELGTVLNHHATHGGHIAGIVAGNDRFVGAQPLPEDAQIIAVQLPNTVAWDTSGFGKEMMMLSAVEYIFQRARMIAEAFESEEIPLIVNFSYGWSANRHDGEASFERAVEALISARRAVQPQTELVMPTGNNFANKMHGHFTQNHEVQSEIRFGWQLKPDDRTSSYLEMWLPPQFDPNDWSVTVTPPEGVTNVAAQTLEIRPDTSLLGGDPRRFVEIEQGSANIGQLSADFHQRNRWRVMLAMAPTAGNRAQNRRTPVGLWTISLNTGATPMADGQAIEAWVQRDDDPTQLGTGGQQSYLVDLTHPKPARALEVAPLSCVRGYGCLNGIGTAPSVLRVAGYVQSTGATSYYSGASSISTLASGTHLVGPEVPLVSAVSDQGQFRPGLPSIGVLSGSGARIIGTSAAAATVARFMAGNILQGRDHKAGFEAAPDMTSHGQLMQAKTLSRSGAYRVGPICRSCLPCSV
ncbi:S8 family serine peptidase [Loktanella sp. S4079]|uniref:S8 family serine peptidase n=1 Tax=Loktanella sp. S4079 TaxID=579483 RepID=UPI0005FA2DE8|nr:S8 family serine peptidase [Loktanella sp. S4079]KJZ17920.1 hypothetical protein TW80_16420 [Loktanella sp. S4079]